MSATGYCGWEALYSSFNNCFIRDRFAIPRVVKLIASFKVSKFPPGSVATCRNIRIPKGGRPAGGAAVGISKIVRLHLQLSMHHAWCIGVFGLVNGRMTSTSQRTCNRCSSILSLFSSFKSYTLIC